MQVSVALTVKVKLPAVDGEPANTPLGVRLRPVGRLPESNARVTGDSPPLAVNLVVNGWPTSRGVRPAGTVKFNGAQRGTDSEITRVKFLSMVCGETLHWPVPLTVKLKFPAVAGTPLRSPAWLRLNPGGKTPD